MIGILITLLTQLFSFITPDSLRKMIDSGLNTIEDDVAKSSNANEIAIILPIITLLRSVTSIPDTHTLAATPAGVSSSQANIVITLITELFKFIPGNMLKKMIDSGLDIIEVDIAKNPTESAIITPIINLIRKTFDIPDDDPQTVAVSSSDAAQTPAK